MRTKSNIKLILTSRIFDAEWYSKNNPDCAGFEPTKHYIKHGFRDLRDPSPLFSCTYYLNKYEDVKASGMNPVVHYLKFGAREDRQPHPFISPRWLRKQLPQNLPKDNPLLSFRFDHIDIGPRPIFDIPLMRSELELAGTASAYDVMAAYSLTSLDDTVRINAFWDSDYIRKNLAANDTKAPSNLFAIWQAMGSTRISPHPLFDRDFVSGKYPHVQEDVDDLSMIEKMMISDCWTETTFSPLFDNEFYRTQFAADELSQQNLTEHYLLEGSSAGFSPNPWFDDVDYRARYLSNAPKMPALLHYLVNGKEPHINLVSKFSSVFYKARHPDIQNNWPGVLLDHYIRFGRLEGRKIGSPIWRDDFFSWDELRVFIRRNAKIFDATKPDVSVVIPVYNQFNHTLRCVWSILQANETAKIQIIIADDGSSDETSAFFSSIPEITYLRNPENIGFLRSCNNAAKSATAPYIYFLNNDTAVLPGAIDSLLEAAILRPDAGLIGSKLVYPDGTLQEAGGFIWRNGDGMNLGRNSDPDVPGYNLVRDVDYISGAAILVLRQVWEDLEGFDTRYSPAYCEDSDFSMRLRSLGWRVLYQPSSTVVHFEGVSSGTDTASGIKSYQIINQKKLAKKWCFALENHLSDQSVDALNIPRPNRPRILIIDAVIPTPDKDAGSVTVKWYMRILLDLGYDVVFIAHDLLPDGNYTRDLQKIGVEVLHRPYVTDINAYLNEFARTFDLFFLYRVGVASQYMSTILTAAPGTPIIFNTVDLHFLRAEREAIRNDSKPEDMQAVMRLRNDELRMMDMATETILLSSMEMDYLQELGNTNSFSVMPLVLPNKDHVPPRKGRTGVAFIGGFGHIPNVDAVEYFLDEIWPALHEADPDMEVHIVGSRAPKSILEISEPNIHVHGFIKDLNAFLDQRIATIVPLQYGAGIKGKIGSSFAAGVPCVSTEIGAEGMGLKTERELLIADDTDTFVKAILRLRDDDLLWSKISEGGRKFVQDNYSPEVMKHRLLRLLAKVSAAPFSGICPFSGQQEMRQFQNSRADSLASSPGAPNSSERVLMTAFAKHCGKPEMPMSRLEQTSYADVSLFGDLPHFNRAFDGGLATPDTAKTALIQLNLDDESIQTMDSILETLSFQCTNLIIAGADLTKSPTKRRSKPEALSALVLHLEQNGWQMRCDYLPLKESILTGVVLIEARRIE